MSSSERHFARCRWQAAADHEFHRFYGTRDAFLVQTLGLDVKTADIVPAGWILRGNLYLDPGPAATRIDADVENPDGMRNAIDLNRAQTIQPVGQLHESSRSRSRTL